MGEIWLCRDCALVHAEEASLCSRCGSDGPLVLLNNPRGLGFDDAIQLFDDMARQAESDVELVDQWIVSLDRQVKLLAKESGRATASDLTVFWIRLHGALVELPLRFAKAAELLSGAPVELFEKHRSTPEGASSLFLLGYQWGVHLESQRLGSSLTEDEHAYAEWRRNVEAHLTQGAYRLQMTKVGALKDEVKIKALETALSAMEFWSAVRRVTDTYGESDLQVASGLAAKLSVPVARLAEAQRRYLELCRQCDASREHAGA
jgi:hypothetical protein